MFRQFVRGPADENRKVRIVEETFVRFREEKRDGIGAPGHQVPRVRIDPVTRFLDRLVDCFESGGTDPMATIRTRETVPRETPASRATSLIVRRRCGERDGTGKPGTTYPFTAPEVRSTRQNRCRKRSIATSGMIESNAPVITSVYMAGTVAP